MNKPSELRGTASTGNGPRNRSKICTAFVFFVMMSAWIGVAAQAPATMSGLERGPKQERLAPRVVKSYVCPMHPDVKAKKSGKCPKCGMDLRLTTAEPASGPNLSTDNAQAESRSIRANLPVVAKSVSSTRKMVIPDVEVLDQNGNQLHFYSDLIKGKTVVINFIFTNCTTICPPLAATFARVQKEMGDKVGKDVTFISISVDPLTDTPERLKAWGAKFNAGSGWTFVTGSKPEIDTLLSALGASVARREDHSPTIIVGNDLKGVWTRTYGLARTSQIVGLILDVMEGKADESQSKETAKP